MRFASMASIGAAALLIGLAPGARADDSDIPGMNRRTASFERPMRDNPEMRAFMAEAAPAPRRRPPSPPG
jgi:hypothetical protein